MIKYNIPISKVKTHQERNGKYCPHRMLDEGRVQWFKDELVKAVNNKKNGVKIMKWVMKTGGLGIDYAQEMMNKLSEFETKGSLVYEGKGIFYVISEPVEDRNKLGALHWYCKDYKGWYIELFQV